LCRSGLQIADPPPRNFLLRPLRRVFSCGRIPPPPPYLARTG
jgi:hypothetical protein